MVERPGLQRLVIEFGAQDCGSCHVVPTPLPFVVNGSEGARRMSSASGGLVVGVSRRDASYVPGMLSVMLGSVRGAAPHLRKL